MHALSAGSQLLYLGLCINHIRPENAQNTSLAPFNQTLQPVTNIGIYKLQSVNCVFVPQNKDIEIEYLTKRYQILNF